MNWSPIACIWISVLLKIGAPFLLRGTLEAATSGVRISSGGAGRASADHEATLRTGQVLVLADRLPEVQVKSAGPGAGPSAVAAQVQLSFRWDPPQQLRLCLGLPGMMPAPPFLAPASLGTERELVHAQGVNHAPWQPLLLRNLKEFKEKPPG